MPQHTSPSSYPDTLRSLKQRASTSETSFRSVGHQLYNHFDQVPDLESQWARRVAVSTQPHRDPKHTCLMRNYLRRPTRLSLTIPRPLQPDSLLSSIVSAAKASHVYPRSPVYAVASVYTLLQPAFAKAQPGDVIHELGTFRKVRVVGTWTQKHPISIFIIVKPLDAIRHRRQLRVTAGRPWWRNRPIFAPLGGSALVRKRMPFRRTTSLSFTRRAPAGNALPTVGGQTAFNENPNSRQGVIANIQYLLHEIEEQKPLFGVIRQIANEVS